MPTLLHAPQRCIAMVIAMLGFVVCLGHAAEPFSPARVAVYFSPNGGATDAVVRAEHFARQSFENLLQFLSLLGRKCHIKDGVPGSKDLRQHPLRFALLVGSN